MASYTGAQLDIDQDVLDQTAKDARNNARLQHGDSGRNIVSVDFSQDDDEKLDAQAHERQRIAERERLAREAQEKAVKAEQDLAREFQERKQKAEQERLAKEDQERAVKAERERLAKEDQERAAKAEQDLAREFQQRKLKAEQERLARETQERERKAEQQKAGQENAEQQRAEQERIAREARLKADQDASVRARKSKKWMWIAIGLFVWWTVIFVGIAANSDPAAGGAFFVEVVLFVWAVIAYRRYRRAKLGL
jgi:hypothetical protein